MKKTFPCGHTGKGQFCHRCHTKNLEMAKRIAQSHLKRNKLETARNQVPGLDMSGVPLRIAEQITEIMKEVKSGNMPRVRKRLSRNKSITVSIHHSAQCKYNR